MFKTRDYEISAVLAGARSFGSLTFVGAEDLQESLTFEPATEEVA
jgi:hypothetical protein